LYKQQGLDIWPLTDHARLVKHLGDAHNRTAAQRAQCDDRRVCAVDAEALVATWEEQVRPLLGHAYHALQRRRYGRLRVGGALRRRCREAREIDERSHRRSHRWRRHDLKMCGRRRQLGDGLVYCVAAARSRRHSSCRHRRSTAPPVTTSPPASPSAATMVGAT
jgi:hypothetical protein